MRRALAACVLLAACARERAAPPVPPYRGETLGATGRIDGRVTLPESASVSGVVVWLDSVRVGKPLPLARRYELDLDGGRFVPAVQAALAGGTLNVRDWDDAPLRARFTFAGPPDSLLDVVEETGAGQVVPAAAPLARPGIVVVTRDGHTAARAFLRVFDQPYFVQPDSAGRFVLDSVPPGRWPMRAWHPSLGERTFTVRVEPGGLAFADLRF